MTHLWQYHFGKPGRRGYHNKEWANKMESIGLMPSSTGQPGGDKTGDKMAEGLSEMLMEMPEQKQTRAKFTCPECGVNVWGKPSLNLICGDCDVTFEAC